MITDTVADFLARMQNGITRKMEIIEVPVSKMVQKIVEILKEESLIEGFEIKDGKILVSVMYNEGASLLTKFTKKSKPGQRIYVTSSSILPVMNGRGISIVSTSSGVMTGAKAKHAKLGGELICEIW